MKNLKLVLSFIAVTLFVCGCSNYRLSGTPTVLPFSNVYVKPVRNDSYAPQATNLLTNEISNAINETPELRTAYSSDAQTILTTRLVEYKRVPIATSATDTALAASYMMEATAICTLERSNGEVIFKNRKVSARVMLYKGDNGVLGNEYQNMPALMRDLGGKVKDAVIGIW